MEGSHQYIVPTVRTTGTFSTQATDTVYNLHLSSAFSRLTFPHSLLQLHGRAHFVTVLYLATRDVYLSYTPYAASDMLMGGAGGLQRLRLGLRFLVRKALVGGARGL